jgi:hypothetical protein
MDTIRKNDGTWIQMYTGGAFWPLAPLPRDVSIFDIAHSLALSCRWTGHVRRHYSVGQHSVIVMRVVEAVLTAMGASAEEIRVAKLEALVHDGSEAYISDIARPTKRQLPNYQVIEKTVMGAVWARFQMREALQRESDTDLLKAVDTEILFAEARQMTRKPPMPWMVQPSDLVPKYTKRIRPWPIWYSEARFLWEFAKLTDARWATVKGYFAVKWEDFKYYDLGIGRSA